jgi:Fe-S cluster assembly protein SufD
MTASLDSLIQLRQNSLSGGSFDGQTDWIDALRRDALGCFKEQGVPTRRLEAWKGTNFGPLSAMQFTRVGPGPTPIDQRNEDIDGNGPLLVFVDGHFDAAASRLIELPEGLRARSLAEVLENEPELVEGRLSALTDFKIQPFVALQTAFLSDGAVITVAPGRQFELPIRLRFLSTSETATPEANSASFPRLLVIAGEGSSLKLIQEHVSIDSAPGFTAYVAEFHLAENSTVESLEVQAEDATRIHFTSVHAHLERSATFDSHVISVGNGLARSELSIILAEPDAETKLCGLFMGRGKAHLDHFTTVDHAAERCTSDEEYRGVLDDQSKGVFRGRVHVRPGAQKTDAKQSNDNLLLSDHATIDTKPQLEIYADDIRASHGSTIGQLDADALFFLAARGIDPDDAKRLLTGAFVRGVVERIESKELRRIASNYVDATLRELKGSPIRQSDFLTEAIKS